MNQPFKAKAHETKIRWWPAFTPPQSPAHAALRGLFSLRRSYVGPLRWCAPEPPDPWEGVRPAKQFGPIAIQTTGACFNLRETRQSEDCLSLNIWTASLDREILQPVMLWIHGGGNLGGSGSEDAYDGASLARRGVTVVTINYRLGVFGFLAHPDAGANFAVLDSLRFSNGSRRTSGLLAEIRTMSRFLGNLPEHRRSALCFRRAGPGGSSIVASCRAAVLSQAPSLNRGRLRGRTRRPSA